jgi:hypothetical protein
MGVWRRRDKEERNGKGEKKKGEELRVNQGKKEKKKEELGADAWG